MGSAGVTSDDVSELADGVVEEARPDWPRGWAQGPKISGGQKTVRSNIFSFEGVAYCGAWRVWGDLDHFRIEAR